MPPQTGPITNSLSLPTQTDVLGILQREQDRAIALISSSPLVTSLFVSYANQAITAESASAIPSPESEEWKALQNTTTALREEIEKLRSENLKLMKELESAKEFRSQVSSLKAVSTTQRDNIKSLQAELAGAKEKYNQHMVDSDAEKGALQVQVLDLEVRSDLRLIIE